MKSAMFPASIAYVRSAEKADDFIRLTGHRRE